MTPTQKAQEAISRALRERGPGLDALLGPRDGLGIFVNFLRDGNAEVDFKPILQKTIIERPDMERLA